MINTNKDLKKKRGNGTLCRGLGIKLKSGSQVKMKEWYEKFIPSVSVDDVEYMICQHYDDSITPLAGFKLFPEKESAKVNLKILGNMAFIGGINMTQFPVNSNIATTGHKLQGMTKDSLIVHAWNYTFTNWIYVVLSRVRTLDGLYLCEKLDETKLFECDEDLLREEKRLAEIEARFLMTVEFVHWLSNAETN